MKRANALVLALLAASLPADAGSASAGPDALLARAIGADASASYTGVVEVVRFGSRTSEASEYRIEHRAPDFTRRLYAAPSSLSGDAVVSKGDVSFAIDAKRRRIVESRNDAMDDPFARKDNYALLRANYEAVGRGADLFDGRQTAGIALVNRWSRRTVLFMRVDRATNVVLDRQEFGPDGAIESEVRFTEIHYAAAIPTSDFALPKAYRLVQGPTFGRPSENAADVVRRAGFQAREPKALPNGFSPVEGTLVELKGVRTVHLLYSDGIRTISLFENAKASNADLSALRPQTTSVAGRSAQYAEEGPLALLTWSDGDLSYTLVGEITLPDLQRIAASLSP